MTYVNYMDSSNCTQTYSDQAARHSPNTGCDNLADENRYGCWDKMSGYVNHNDYTDCSQQYSDHNDYSIPYPQAYSINAQNFVQDGYITSGVQNLKTLRDDTSDLATKKVRSTGLPLTSSDDPLNTVNTDGSFATDQKPVDEQIEETITNVKRLWQAIKGNNDSSWQNWPADTQDENTLTAQSYTFLKDKVQSLASQDQPPAPSGNYANHMDTGYGDYGDVAHTTCIQSYRDASYMNSYADGEYNDNYNNSSYLNV